MKCFKAILLALLVCSCLGIYAGKKGKVEQQKIYMYGFSVSFVDSVAYLTDVVELDSATILSNGFLAERQLYSIQLESYIQEQFKIANSTNAVFFSKKRKDLDAKREKMDHRYKRSNNLALYYLTADDFRFHPEEHIEAVEIDENENQAADAQNETAADKNGKKSKSKKSKSKKSEPEKSKSKKSKSKK